MANAAQPDLVLEVLLQLIDAHSQVEVQLHGPILYLHIPAPHHLTLVYADHVDPPYNRY